MANTFVFDDEQPQPEQEAPAPDAPEPEKPEGGDGNNRTFLIAAIILGGIVLLSLICMAVYALVIMPGQKTRAQATSDANAAAGTQMAMEQFLTAEASMFTATIPPTETAIPEPTETLVVVFSSQTPSPAPTTDPATSTVEALQTQLAIAQATTDSKTITGTPGTPSKLAKTGFADEVGLPGLFIAALLVIVVIMLSRRLRQSPQ